MWSSKVDLTDSKSEEPKSEGNPKSETNPNDEQQSRAGSDFGFLFFRIWFFGFRISVFTVLFRISRFGFLISALRLIQLVQQPPQRLSVFQRQPVSLHQTGQQWMNLTLAQLVCRSL